MYCIAKRLHPYEHTWLLSDRAVPVTAAAVYKEEEQKPRNDKQHPLISAQFSISKLYTVKLNDYTLANIHVFFRTEQSLDTVVTL